MTTTEVKGFCETCDRRRQEPVEIDGKVDIAHFCEEFDYFVPPKGWCWQYEPLQKL